MINVPSNEAKMVEYNTIASSFGILSQRVGQIQHYIRSKYPHMAKQKYQQLDPDSQSYS